MAQKCPPESEKVDEAHKLLEFVCFFAGIWNHALRTKRFLSRNVPPAQKELKMEGILKCFHTSALVCSGPIVAMSVLCSLEAEITDVSAHCTHIDNDMASLSFGKIIKL